MNCNSSQNNKLVGTEKLNKLFMKKENTIQYYYRDQCHYCGCGIEVLITKTSEGYGLEGGAICHNNLQKIYGICADCYVELVDPL